MENHGSEFGDHFKEESLKEIKQEIKWSFKKIFWWVLGCILLLGAIFWALDIVLTPAQTAKDVIQKTLDADNVLENYEWYKSQYNDCEAINIKIRQADKSVERFEKNAGPRDNWDYMDKDEHSRLTSIADGLRYQREDLESKYNARSQMLNRNIFKSSDLPYMLKNGEEDREI